MTNAKPMSASKAVQTKIVLPPDTNHINSIFGGVVLAHIDEIAAIAAMTHAEARAAVTASIDSVDFISPAKLGETIMLEAMVTSVGRTSMEVFISVHSKNLVTGEVKLTTESFCTMVAVDENNCPFEVPKVYPETDFEKRLFETAPERRSLRQQQRGIKY